MEKINKGRKVQVYSGDKLFTGIVQDVAWDFDQWAYKVNDEWYCQSEVEDIDDNCE